MVSLQDSKFARISTLCALYFAQGFPWGFMTVGLVAYLAKHGITVEESGGLIAMAILPWTFKIIWAPLIDSINFPSMGRRRPWIIFAEIMMALTLITLAMSGDIVSDLGYLSWMFFLHNCFASMQDVCTDALAVDILLPEERGQVNGFMWSSKIVGVGIGSSVMGTILVNTSMNFTIIIQTILILIVMLFPLLFRERTGEKLLPWTKGKSMLSDKMGAVRSPLNVLKDLKRAFSLKATFFGGIFLLTASLGEGINSALLPVLYMQELGWEPDSYSQVVGGIGTVLEFIGAILGGYLADRVGRKKIIVIGYGGFGVVALIFGFFAVHWNSDLFASGYLVLYPFFRALGSVAVFALFMHISWTKSAATMFTSYMAMSNISSTIGNKIAGPLNNMILYDWSFIVLGILALIPLMFVLFIDANKVPIKEPDEY